MSRLGVKDHNLWWVHPGALGSRTSGCCAQILDKEAIACTQRSPQRPGSSPAANLTYHAGRLA
eukprot:scaffold107171_cov99-Phaeocystis_antarctica.AAC.5